MTTSCKNCKLCILIISRLPSPPPNNYNGFTIILKNFIRLLLRYNGLCGISTDSSTPVLDTRTSFHNHIMDIFYRTQLPTAFYIRCRHHVSGGCYRGLQTAKNHALLKGHFFVLSQDWLNCLPSTAVEFTTQNTRLSSTPPTQYFKEYCRH